MESTKEKIEKLREILHDVINNGSVTEIMAVSQEMDKLILEFIKQSKQKPEDNA